MPVERTFQDYVDPFFPVDASVRDWCETAPLDRGGNLVPVVFASPEGAFAGMERLLKKTLGDSLAERARNVPLPFISIHRKDITPDPERFHGAATKIRLAATSDNKKIFQMPFPRPYDWTYQIEVWTKHQETKNIFQGWMIQQWPSHEMLLDVNFDQGQGNTSLIGTKAIPFELQGAMDNSDLEPEDGERLLRFTLEIVAKAWIHGTVQEVGTVLEIFSDIYTVEDSSIDLTKVTAAQVDADPVTFSLESRTTIDENS